MRIDDYESILKMYSSEDEISAEFDDTLKVDAEDRPRESICVTDPLERLNGMDDASFRNEVCGETSTLYWRFYFWVHDMNDGNRNRPFGVSFGEFIASLSDDRYRWFRDVQYERICHDGANGNGR